MFACMSCVSYIRLELARCQDLGALSLLAMRGGGHLQDARKFVNSNRQHFLARMSYTEVVRMDFWTRCMAEYRKPAPNRHAVFGGEAFEYAMGLITGSITPLGDSTRITP